MDVATEAQDRELLCVLKISQALRKFQPVGKNLKSAQQFSMETLVMENVAVSSRAYLPFDEHKYALKGGTEQKLANC